MQVCDLSICAATAAAVTGEVAAGWGIKKGRGRECVRDRSGWISKHVTCDECYKYCPDHYEGVATNNH